MNVNGSEITFSRSRAAFLNYWIGFNIILFVIILVRYFMKGGSPFFGYAIFINIILIISRLSTYRLKTLIVNKEKSTVSIELDKFFVRKKILLCSMDHLTADIYREHRARGVMGEVFKIHCKDKLLVEAVPGLSGWSRNQFNAFIEIINIPSQGLVNSK